MMKTTAELEASGVIPPWTITQADEITRRAYQLREDAELKAIDSLARYKFEMFGYWAAIWVDTNRIIGDKRPSPFRGLVGFARGLQGNGR